MIEVFSIFTAVVDRQKYTHTHSHTNEENKSKGILEGWWIVTVSIAVVILYYSLTKYPH